MIEVKRWEIYLEFILEFIFCIGGLALLIWGLPKVLGFLWPFVVGWIVALIAAPLCNFLEHKLKVSRKWGSMLILILSIAAVAGIISLFFYTLGSQALDWAAHLPGIYQRTLDNLNQAILKLSKHQFAELPIIHTAVRHVLDSANSGLSTIVGSIGSYGVEHAGDMAKSVTNGLIGTIVMLLAAYLLICEREKILSEYEKIVPDYIKEKVDIFCKNTLGVLVDYVVVQMKLMMVIVVILFVGFLILKIPYAILFAFLISLLDVLPFLGTGTVLIPWAIYQGVTGHGTICVGFIVLYVICLVLKQILQPKMLGDRMELNSLVTLVLMYTGLKLKGIIGLIYALIFGIFLTNLYKRGAFDSMINRSKKRLIMLHELEQESK
jgi:sporulation integral membrane protein YtvI